MNQIIAEHAQKLARYVVSMGARKRITAVHLYGIEFGAILDTLTVAQCKSLARKADLKESLGTELHKGIRLSHFAKKI